MAVKPGETRSRYFLARKVPLRAPNLAPRKVAADRLQASMTVEGLRTDGSDRRPRVLLVEDNVLNMELGRDLLKAAGFVVLEAETAETALMLARTMKPDLVVMDLRLPGMDPLTATREIRRDAGIAHIPVVALIAQSTGQDEAAARAAGCAGFIVKPIDPSTFVGDVRRHLPVATG